MGRKIDTAETDFSGYVVPLINGGTSARSLVKAAKALNILTNDMKGVANGAVPLDGQGKIPASLIPVTNGAYGVNVSGNLRMTIGSVNVLKITDYDSFKIYTISFSSGTFTRNGDTITYTAGLDVGNQTLTINDRVIQFTLIIAAPETPNITSPTANATIATASYNITGSVFVEYGDSATHMSSDWQVSTVNDFSTVTFQSMNNTVNKLSWNVSGFLDGTIYYARVRYKATNGNSSDWSVIRAFSLTIPTPAVPNITSPANAAIKVSATPVITTSVFTAIADGSSHLNTDWQIASDAGFNNIVKSSVANSVNKVSWTSPTLALITTYYVRARHRSSNGKVSNWSNGVQFTTLNEFVFNQTIVANTNDYDLRNRIVAAGWNQIDPITATVTVNSGVVVGSSSVSRYAFNTQSQYPIGSRLILNVLSGGYIVGRGGDANSGAGGPALNIDPQIPTTINNAGTIGGGGGGGGAGLYWHASAPTKFDLILTYYAGSGGGGGAGSNTGIGGPRIGSTSFHAGESHGEPHEATSGYNSTLTIGGTAGGVSMAYISGGYAASHEGYGGPGGVGGNLGAAGASGGGGLAGRGVPYAGGADYLAPGSWTCVTDVLAGAGGAPGAAIVGNSYTTWVAIGNRLGPVL